MSQSSPPVAPGARGRPRRGWRVLGFVLAGLGAAVVLGGCRNLPTFGTFTPVTKQEIDAYNLYQSLTIAAMVVGGFVWGLIFWCIFRYRRRRRHVETGELPKQTRYNIKWEFVYTVTPFLVVIGIFIYTVKAEDVADAVVSHPNVTVDVNAFQWGWQFNYPVGDGRVIKILPSANVPTPAQASSPNPGEASPVSYPVMVLPLGQTTHVNLVSNDVVHGFYVPAFEFSRYAQPGVTNEFDFTPNRTGLFPARCTQYCGLYHTQMQFWVHVVTPATYRAWVRSGGHSIPTQHRAGGREG